MKKMMFGMILCCLLLSGCGTKLNLYTPPQGDAPEHIINKNYTVGEQKTVYTGETIISIKDYNIFSKYGSSIIASNSFELDFPLDTMPISKDIPLSIYGTIEYDNKKHIVAGQSHFEFALIFNEAMEYINRCYNLLAGVVTIVNLPIEPNNTTFKLEHTKEIKINSAELNFELVYVGCDDNSLHFMYREYTGEDLIKPAFTHSLTYPKNVTKIRYKNFVVEVHKADAESISYTVIEDGLPDKQEK